MVFYATENRYKLNKLTVLNNLLGSYLHKKGGLLAHPTRQ
jgi:hypothetical protein